LYNALKLMRLH